MVIVVTIHLYIPKYSILLVISMNKTIRSEILVCHPGSRMLYPKKAVIDVDGNLLYVKHKQPIGVVK